MNTLIISLLELVMMASGILVFLIFAWVVMSWLVSFGIMNLRNPLVAQIYNAVNRLLAPIMAPFQRLIPPIGGMDLSPIVVLLLLQWLSSSLIPRVIMSLS